MIRFPVSSARVTSDDDQMEEAAGQDEFMLDVKVMFQESEGHKQTGDKRFDVDPRLGSDQQVKSMRLTFRHQTLELRHTNLTCLV